MNILRIISSTRGALSYSTKLGNGIVAQLEQAYPGSAITTRNLSRNPFSYLEEAHVTGYNTPEETHTPEVTAALKHSDEAIAELMDADSVVIDVPMYNFTIPATLKSWIDHIVRAKHTFTYSAAGPEGLVKGKKVYLAISSGAIYSEGPMKDFDFTEPYLRTLLGFIGMTDLTAFRAEGVNYPGAGEAALSKALDKVDQHRF